MYKVVYTLHFKKQLKPLVRKYRNLQEDIGEMLLAFDKRLGIALGNYTYKVRLKSRDLPRGKSKSFRLVVFVVEHRGLLAPIAIYFKGKREDIDKKEIEYHLLMTIKELEKDTSSDN